jgi:hypothetical protein
MRDQATFDVPSMRLGDVLVLANDDRTADPELFGLVVIVSRQSLEDIVTFAMVNFVSSGIHWIRAEQAIGDVAFDFLTIGKFGQHRARRDNNLACPVIGWKLLREKAAGFDLFPIERFL